MRLTRGIVLATTLLLTAACAGVHGARAATAAAAAAAQDGGASREQWVKAAFIERFLSFVTWPGAKAGADTVVIGVVGDTPMAEALAALVDHEPKRPLRVLTDLPPAELVRRCHLVFVPAIIDGQPRADHPQWGRLDWTAADGVLTVGEDPGFAADGGVIGFYPERDRLRFRISAGAADRADLQIGSKLMRLAEIVP